MPKNSNSKPVKRDEPMTGAMKFFLAGCVAELYLLIVRRFYANGNALQQIAWYDHYLFYLMGAGAVLLTIGAVCAVLWKADRKKLFPAVSVAAAGAFLGLSALLIRWNVSILTLLTVVVPVVMLLGILWSLYDRECALALTILGITLIVLWVCRRSGASMYFGIYVKAISVIYLVLAVAVAVLVKHGKLRKLLPANADPLPVYVACGLSVVAIAAALVNVTVAYYIMWGLAIVVFALAVYYTVKQL